MDDTASTALAIYRKVDARYNKGKASLQDELLLGLWDMATKQLKTIQEMAQAVSAANDKCAELARGSTVKT